MSIKHLLTISLIFLSSALCRAQESVFLESFQYDKRIHDFGTIQEKDGKVSHTFVFTNRSKEVMQALRDNPVTAREEYDNGLDENDPGLTFTLTYDPDHRPGKFSKEAVLKLNGGKYYTRIWVKGNVVGMKHPVTEDHPYAYGSGLYMSHRVLPFPLMRVGEEKSIRLLVANDTKETMTIEFERRPNNRILKFPDRLVLKPGESTKVYARYRAFRPVSYRRHISIIPKVNGKALKPLKISWDVIQK